MKKQRKIVFWAASLLLTGALAAGGTLAYLTDKDSVTNQFVVGKVDIEGHEPSYAPDPDGKTNHIVPTQVIPKDPRIKNKGKNDSYVYMDVSIPIAKVIVADTSGNRLNGGAAVDTELFSMNQLSKKWVLMYKKKQNNSMVYTYLYNEVLAAGKTTDPLFTSVTAANIVEGQLDEKEVDIPINYYAIQALNTGEGSTVAERAAKAWEKYVNQNNGQKGQVTAPQSEPEQTVLHRHMSGRVPQLDWHLDEAGTRQLSNMVTRRHILVARAQERRNPQLSRHVSKRRRSRSF